MTVTVSDGTALDVSLTGPDDAAMTAVLIHGLGMAAASWTRVRRHLLASSPQTRILAYDHRGHGRSADGPRHSHTLATLAADLDELLVTAVPPGPILLIGHSLGAMTALTYLARGGAERTRIQGVGLVSATAGGLFDHGAARLLPERVVDRLPAMAERFPGVFDSGWDCARRLLAPAVGTRTGPHCRRPSPAVLAELIASIRAMNARPHLGRLRAIPTVVVAGGRDRVTPLGHARAISDALPSCDLQVLPEAGHNVPGTHPESLVGALSGLINPDRCRGDMRL
ncbi:alpha/beta hydrolase [Gordonia alkaliphila]|uniref:alpha/beta fold hydrolase n=1 Tax=Gordonia alkaliphila TaxID=1053547 RepID=UPI001FF63483|nr:alpha/beta fold hydrolase [Gordonia alkaliphila]MCK0441084.1 alpha/beta hydrolase [Gordonia alkaliphila]